MPQTVTTLEEKVFKRWQSSNETSRVGPDPVGRVSLEEEIRTQTHTERRLCEARVERTSICQPRVEAPKKPVPLTP